MRARASGSTQKNPGQAGDDPVVHGRRNPVKETAAFTLVSTLYLPNWHSRMHNIEIITLPSLQHIGTPHLAAAAVAAAAKDLKILTRRLYKFDQRWRRHLWSEAKLASCSIGTVSLREVSWLRCKQLRSPVYMIMQISIYNLFRWLRMPLFSGHIYLTRKQSPVSWVGKNRSIKHQFIKKHFNPSYSGYWPFIFYV